jgi:hypothetical protein
MIIKPVQLVRRGFFGSKMILNWQLTNVVGHMQGHRIIGRRLVSKQLGLEKRCKACHCVQDQVLEPGKG